MYHTCTAFPSVDDAYDLPGLAGLDPERALVGVGLAIRPAHGFQVEGAHGVAAADRVPVLVQLAHLGRRAFDAFARVWKEFELLRENGLVLE